MAKVIAIDRGYMGGQIREPGDIFEAEGEARWFKPYRAERAADAADPAPVDAKARAKPGPKPRAETVQAPTSQPFMDAPEPVTVRVENAINAATGATQPDWVAPSDI